jgi:hypothetical protein
VTGFGAAMRLIEFEAPWPAMRFAAFCLWTLLLRRA